MMPSTTQIIAPIMPKKVPTGTTAATHSAARMVKRIRSFTNICTSKKYSLIYIIYCTRARVKSQEKPVDFYGKRAYNIRWEWNYGKEKDKNRSARALEGD